MNFFLGVSLGIFTQGGNDPEEHCAFLAYLVCYMLLNKSAVRQQWLVENGPAFVGILPAKMETCTEGVLSGERRGECAHCWLPGIEYVPVQDLVMLFRQIFLGQLNNGILHGAMYEVEDPQYGSMDGEAQVLR